MLSHIGWKGLYIIGKGNYIDGKPIYTGWNGVDRKNIAARNGLMTGNKVFMYSYMDSETTYRAIMSAAIKTIKVTGDYVKVSMKWISYKE